MVRRARLVLLLAASLGPALAAAERAQAADATRVATAFEPGNPFDLYLSIGWRYENKSAKIKREFENPGQTLGAIGQVRDLTYLRTRNILDLRLDFGLLPDVGLHIGAPIILADSRSLSFDQEATPCSFTGPTPSCVNQTNSTVLSDKGGPSLLPSSSSGWGLDATGSTPALYKSGTKVFEGPLRAGIESLNLGLDWALMNQRKDDTKPTWTVGIEGRIQISETQSFDRSRPSANTSVGLGYHVLRFQTLLSKRFRTFDPYFGFFYEMPIVHGQRAFPDFTEPGAHWGNQVAASGSGQRRTSPMQVAGVTFGFEAAVFENPKKKHRVAIDARGQLTTHLEGRGWSELWEVLACNQSDPMAFRSSLCPVDPTQLDALPGTTDIENYVTVAGDLGVTIQAAGMLYFRAGFGVDHDESHLITFTSAGKDRAPLDGRVDPSNPEEVNPLHRPQVDLVGRRFIVDDVMNYRASFVGMLLF